MKRRTFMGLVTSGVAMTVVPSSLAAGMARPKRCGGLDYRPRLTKERMAELYADVEVWDDVVSVVWLNPADAADLTPVLGPDVFDREYNLPVLDMGIVGHLWGAPIFQNEAIPVGYVGMAGGTDGVLDLDVPPRLRSLGASRVERRLFKGSYLTWGPYERRAWDIEVWGEHRFERLPEGVWSHTYEFKGHVAPFIRTYVHALSDQQVIDQLMHQLVGRAAKHDGILAKMAKDARGRNWPMWLFRTSVKHYHVHQPGLLGIDHTDLDILDLIKCAKVGPVV